jgi:inositol hexakisphosphate/diphosphoinositol-pentakisphosphate kinase
LNIFFSEPDFISSQPCLLLIVKWGGQLTQSGKSQAEALGKAFRKMYPGGQGAGGDRPDVGLLRLHSTFRHDLKIYASDEGRVQMTAAAFAKGLLALDGELAPILVQMVKSANTNGLLDNDADSTKEKNKVKQTLHDLLTKDREFTQEDYDKVCLKLISFSLLLYCMLNRLHLLVHVHFLHHWILLKIRWSFVGKYLNIFMK